MTLGQTMHDHGTDMETGLAYTRRRTTLGQTMHDLGSDNAQAWLIPEDARPWVRRCTTMGQTTHNLGSDNA